MFNDDLAKFVDLERAIKDRTISSTNLYVAEDSTELQDPLDDDISPLADAA